MKISGFTIIRNAVINDYPIVEAICSILPMVHEMVVLVGDCEDDTERLIQAIPSDKIKIHRSVWDMTSRKGGRILAVETDKALQLIDADADWAFYIQADEVVHEKYHEKILGACKIHLHNPKVQGLLFNYTHFYGTYDYVGDSRKWYKHEIRIIRNDKNIKAYRDAQGFRYNNKQKLRAKPANGYVYHYGWVKNPQKMLEKNNNVTKLWNDDEELKNIKLGVHFDYSDFDSLALFKETHPEVMKSRIAEQNWQVNLDIFKKKFSFKNKCLY